MKPEQVELFLAAFEYQLREMNSVGAAGCRRVIEYDETRAWLRAAPSLELMERVRALANTLGWVVVGVYFPTTRCSAYAIEVSRPQLHHPAKLSTV